MEGIEAREDAGKVHVAVLPTVVLQEVTCNSIIIMQDSARLKRMRERFMRLSCQQ
jgi:hypothetical protein